MKRLLSLLLSVLCAPVFGQSIITLPADCGDITHPVVLTDTVYGPTSAPSGHGTDLEFSGNAVDDSLYVEDEHNTAWYKYTVPCPCELTFDITPVSINDDYDFMLFLARNPPADYAQRVRSKIVRPVRSCISRNDKKLKSMTGLSKDVDQKYIHQGVGPSYVASLPVNKGDQLYLMVDNVYQNGRGHTLHIHCPPPKPGQYFVGFKLDLGAVNFVPEEDTILTSCYPVIDSLVAIMKRFPTMKVEIGGHVNAPTSAFKPKKYSIQQLSELRAKRVMEYCVAHGIERKRLKPVGYGNAHMIYPHANNIQQYKANMRVEMIVIGL